jgi:flagellin-like protein
MKRTGVSPVIATLLLIVIAVAAAVLAYIWIIGYQGTLTQQASTAQLQERIKIEAVGYYPAAGNKLNASVRNIGDVTVNVTAIYVYNVTTGSVVASEILTGSNAVVLAPGEVKPVPPKGQEVIVVLKPGVTYTVKVVTQKGTEATYTFTYRT